MGLAYFVQCSLNQHDRGNGSTRPGRSRSLHPTCCGPLTARIASNGTRPGISPAAVAAGQADTASRTALSASARCHWPSAVAPPADAGTDHARSGERSVGSAAPIRGARPVVG
jgi:hypothetical protein